MFLTGKSGYNTEGSQFADGDFLIICQKPGATEHFMMGTAYLGGHAVVLSGSYGNDGLPLSLEHKVLPPGAPERIFAALTPIPEGLQTSFWEGGGHNSAGAEAPALRKWAEENLTELMKAIPREDTCRPDCSAPTAKSK
jgi:hypothetical protein